MQINQGVKMANTRYSADLRLNTTEKVGPKTNSRDVGILHPDMHQDSADRGRLHKSYRPAHRSTWLPGKLGATNVNLKNLTDENGDARDGMDTQGNIDRNKKIHVDKVAESAEAVYMNEQYAHETDGTTHIQQDEDKKLYKED